MLIIWFSLGLTHRSIKNMLRTSLKHSFIQGHKIDSARENEGKAMV